MKLVDLYDKAVAHHEAAVAILDAFLPHGQKGPFVRGIGRTPSWFSRFCNIERCDPTYLPSVETAKEMARKLPAPKLYRDALIFHVTEAKRLRSEIKRGIKDSVAERFPIQERLAEIAEYHKIARYSTDTEQVRHHYRRVFDIANMCLSEIETTVNPLDFLYLCGFMIDVSYTLDRADIGVYWSKIMGRVITRLLGRTGIDRELRESLIEQQILQSHNEGTGYHNLNKDNYALQCYDRALEIIKSRPHNQKWTPAIYRGKLIALCGTPRFLSLKPKTFLNVV
ncbi:MAG: hypothetical protein RMJ60_01600 [Anaerolineales bacterium]|nr:hypothetical protein [Anaerolineales bacterium]